MSTNPLDLKAPIYADTHLLVVFSASAWRILTDNKGPRARGEYISRRQTTIPAGEVVVVAETVEREHQGYLIVTWKGERYQVHKSGLAGNPDPVEVAHYLAESLIQRNRADALEAKLATAVEAAGIVNEAKLDAERAYAQACEANARLQARLEGLIASVQLGIEAATSRR
jgi:hypothetical protein